MSLLLGEMSIEHVLWGLGDSLPLKIFNEPHLLIIAHENIVEMFNEHFFNGDICIVAATIFIEDLCDSVLSLSGKNDVVKKKSEILLSIKQQKLLISLCPVLCISINLTAYVNF